MKRIQIAPIEPLEPKAYSARPRLSSHISPPRSYDSRTNPRNAFDNIHDVDNFLNEELSKAHSDSDKMFAYQRAFDKLISEFQTCRPLLERIKQQYDSISLELISKKREITTNATSLTSTEDSYSETINELRRARTQEFAQSKSESERLLDEMTEMRVKRSELLEQLEVLSQKENELIETDTSNNDEILELTTKLNELMEFIKETENASSNSKGQIAELQDRIDKTKLSADELKKKDDEMQEKINSLENEEKELNEKIHEMESQTTITNHDIIELQKENDSLVTKKIDASERLDLLKRNRIENEEKLREMLEGTEIDPNLPIDELIKEVQRLIG